MGGPGYSASCPVCGYEHDFQTKAEMNTAWRRWLKAIKTYRPAAKRLA